MSVIYLIRHGQASFGAANYDRLSPRGVEQARALGASLRERLPAVDLAVAGTLRRHNQTAEACFEAMGQAPTLAPELTIDPAFDEFDHEEVVARYEPRYADHAALGGDLAKAERPMVAFQEMFAKAVLRWASGAHDDEYTEPWPAFTARCQAGLESLAERLGHGRTALVFTSGGPISLLMSRLLRISDADSFEIQWRLVNASVSKVIVARRGLAFGSLGEQGHLEHDAANLITYR